MNWVQRQFYALYEPDMPNSVTLDAVAYRKVQTFKYDFFAATVLYEGQGRQVVVKIYRVRRFFGLPMGWTGRLQVGHETRLYRLLAGIEGIPEYLGRVGKTGFVHAFVPGGPLRRKATVADDFFAGLANTLQAVHERGVAYVDLNKPENILLGEDGRGHLIDFQISYAPRRRFFLTRFVLRQLQREDWYHLLKHKRRLRPDQLTDEERQRGERRSTAINLHRILSRPYFLIRRPVMRLLGLKRAE